MTATVHVGDALTVLRTLPDESVQCCVTSPPYWGLRDYGVAGQLGLEETLQQYVNHLVGVFAEVRRVLSEDGVLWLNLGDSYVQAHRGGDPYSGTNSRTARNPGKGKQATVCGAYPRTIRRVAGLKPKDLIGLPWTVAFALQADGWWLRSDCIWHKPSPMPESVTDRPTKAHEYVFLLSKSARYFYDLEAVREPVSEHNTGEISVAPHGDHVAELGHRKQERRRYDVIKGANLRTVWTIPTQPFAGAHFATFPEALAERCILAGCARDGVVLDPFTGSGTTGAVAVRLGRQFVGVELNPKYAAMARKRITAVAPLFVQAQERLA